MVKVGSSTSSGAKYAVGDRVFVYWDEDEYYYPAKVTAVKGDQISVTYYGYEGGADANDVVSADDVEEGSFDTEDEIEVYWEEDEDYYDASVVKDKGTTLTITFISDEDEEEDDEEYEVDLGDVRYYYDDDEDDEDEDDEDEDEDDDDN